MFIKEKTYAKLKYTQAIKKDNSFEQIVKILHASYFIIYKLKQM